jgi:hypothetical protein
VYYRESEERVREKVGCLGDIGGEVENEGKE